VNDVLRFFLSVLEVYGYTTVDTGGMVKIVPSKEAPRKSIETGPAGQYRPAEDKLVTQTIRLTYLSPDEAKSLLKPLLSESGDIVSHPASGTLIITDFHPNIERQQKIIKALDVPIAQEGGAVAGEAVIVKVIDLDHADAEQLASVLRPLLTTDGRITVYAPTNTLIIRDEKSLVEQLVRVIKGE
jgi:general secretion pathway protein D